MSVAAKKALKRKQKRQRKRGVFVDGDGHAFVEVNYEERAPGQVGRVGLVGEGVSFSQKALPSAAKILVQRRRRQQVDQMKLEKDEKEEEDELEDEDYFERGSGVTLSDFFIASSILLDETRSSNTFSHLSPEECVAAVVSNITLVSEASKEGCENEAVLEQLREVCKSLREVICFHVENPCLKEQTLASLLDSLQTLDSFLDLKRDSSGV